VSEDLSDLKNNSFIILNKETNYLLQAHKAGNTGRLIAQKYPLSTQKYLFFIWQIFLSIPLTHFVGQKSPKK
jgi:hypothetical protein